MALAASRLVTDSTLCGLRRRRSSAELARCGSATYCARPGGSRIRERCRCVRPPPDSGVLVAAEGERRGRQALRRDGPSAAGSPPLQRTGRWRRSRSSPFGIRLRASAAAPLPIERGGAQQRLSMCLGLCFGGCVCGDARGGGRGGRRKLRFICWGEALGHREVWQRRGRPRIVQRYGRRVRRYGRGLRDRRSGRHELRRRRQRRRRGHRWLRPRPLCSGGQSRTISEATARPWRQATLAATRLAV